MLLVITVVGVPAGESIASARRLRIPKESSPLPLSNFWGRFGYWLVIVARRAVDVFGFASEPVRCVTIALAMAQDRTPACAVRNIARATPDSDHRDLGYICRRVGDLAGVVRRERCRRGGRALIFLITFALTHWVAILVRQRSSWPPPFKVPLFSGRPSHRRAGMYWAGYFSRHRRAQGRRHHCRDLAEALVACCFWLCLPVERV